MGFEFEGVEYAKSRDMQAVRRQRYVECLDAGMNFTQAAHAVGVSKRTGKVWRNGRTRATGRNEEPLVHWYPKRVEPKNQALSGRYLAESDRLLIADLRRDGKPLRAIAARLGRSVSTISRELRRNAQDDGDYLPHVAHQYATERAKRHKARKLKEGTPLYGYVLAGLRRHWSPEEISHRIRQDHPDNGAMRVCHETIYQAIYIQPKGELRKMLSTALRKGRAVRVPRTGRKPRQRFREPMVMISERPAEVMDRAVPGHWEGDLICGAANKSAIATLVERQTRYTILCALPDGHDAEHVQDAIIRKMRTLPAPLLNSLTWDQGAELALHHRISAATGMDVFFCDPHSPWQRGTNENTNGLLRQYFPKGTDLSGYSQEYLDAVADELNDRPRKTLDWAKPAERIVELLNDIEYAG